MQNGNQHYRYLARREGSPYRQYFVKGRRLRAATLYAETRGPNGDTPEEVANDYDIPVEAVHEAIAYCLGNAELLKQESDEEQAWERSHGFDKPPFVPIEAELNP